MSTIFPTLTVGQYLWLIFIFLLWGLFLFGGFVFGKSDNDKKRRMPRWTRMASSAALVVAGWSWALFSLDSDAEFYAFLIAAGMTLGLIGDLFMAKLIRWRNRVLNGMVAFGLGHMLYIFAFIYFGNTQGLDDTIVRLVSLGAWLAVGTAGWYLVIVRKQRLSPLHWGALPYTLLLSSTCGFATALAMQTPWFIPLALGAALFLISDLILAAELFNDFHFPYIGDAIWLTYGPGQMLIVYSTGAALALSAIR